MHPRKHSNDIVYIHEYISVYGEYDKMFLVCLLYYGM